MTNKTEEVVAKAAAALKEEFINRIFDEFVATMWDNDTMLDMLREISIKIRNSEIRK